MEHHTSYGFQTFSENACFLCGASESELITEEHVFPKWLQREFDLWNQTIQLLNGTSLRYRDLRVPCCRECNEVHLSAIENLVSRAVRAGYESSAQIEERVWYLWVSKLFYGVLRKELSLRLDREDRDSGTILDQKTLEAFEHMHLFLQGVRGKHQFSGPVPYTVLVCNLHDVGSPYDLRDDLIRFTAAIKLRCVGVIVSFNDGGLIRETYAEYVRQVAGRKLHPVQFWELYAKISYQVHLRKRPISYVTASHIDGEGVATTSVLSAATALEDWDQSVFVQLLRFHLMPFVNPELIEHEPPDLVTTFMSDDSGDLLLLSREEWGGA